MKVFADFELIFLQLKIFYVSHYIINVNKVHVRFFLLYLLIDKIIFIDFTFARNTSKTIYWIIFQTKVKSNSYV